MKRIKTKSFTGISILTIFLLFIAVSPVIAEYPEKPIQIIVPFSAGGSTDTGTRAFAKVFPKYIGVPVTVIGKAGGAGTLGANMLAKARPDGYTLGNMPIGPAVLQPLYHKLPYKTKDLRFFALYTVSVNVLAVRADSKFETLKDLLDYARTHPGEITYGCVKGARNYLAIKQLEKMTGTQFTFVATKGIAPARTMVLGGTLDFVAADAVTSVKDFIEGKKLRGLAYSGESRSPEIPDVPTYREQGLDLVVSQWMAYAAPAKTPEPILNKLEAAAKKTIEDPEYLSLMKKLGQPVVYKDAATTKAFVEKQVTELTPLVEALGMRKK